MNARLGGHGKHVHALAEHDPATGWGVAACQRWSGLATLTDERVTCYQCQRLALKPLSEEAVEARRPLPPIERMDAIQTPAHAPSSKVRPARARRAQTPEQRAAGQARIDLVTGKRLGDDLGDDTKEDS